MTADSLDGDLTPNPASQRLGDRAAELMQMGQIELNSIVRATKSLAEDHDISPTLIKPSSCKYLNNLERYGTVAITTMESAATMLARKDIARMSSADVDAMKQTNAGVTASLETMRAPILQTCKKFEP